MSTDVDVLIIGAGLSGIGAAQHIASAFPRRSYAVLESRERLGGTWDLFRYPGVRSDSDMHTLGYRFRPWTAPQAIAEGPDILRYLADTAEETGVARHIRYRHRVLRADWSSVDGRWTVTAEHDGAEVVLTARFLYSCTGYYRYDAGHQPDFPGIGAFRGTVVHPQDWPSDLDHSGRRVVVIGSGATAVTLVPALAETAEHVTMLQRSPSYILPTPGRDPLAAKLRGRLGPRGAAAVVRWKNVAVQILLYQLSRRRPETVKRLIRNATAAALPAGFDVDTHFRPAYQPWDQRLCIVPDGDLFTALGSGKADVVTDTIDTFTPDGIRLRSGTELPADLVITATGLRLLPLGGIGLTVDGRPVELPDTLAYKGVMLSGVPNFAFTIGYTNASWTLRADLVGEYVVRLLAFLDRRGYSRAVPVRGRGVAERPLLDFDAGYVLRSIGQFPKAGARSPWRLHNNYLKDVLLLRHNRIDDGVLRFA